MPSTIQESTMANERKTENLVQNYFSQFSSQIRIEEQKSDDEKINKLLKTASKKGTGAGYPEFLITYTSNSNFLIVVECKADLKKHESSARDNYGDFAVDGVLLYASYLTKDFDVLAIAVSGETKEHLEISHFLQLKGEQKAIPIFGNELLAASDYLKGYLNSPQKFRQDYTELLNFAKKLNDKLHSNKILESQRALLISCVLIALENEAFRNSYSSYKTAKNLAKALVETVSNELEEANIQTDKVEKLKSQFSFIKTDTSLSEKENVLKGFIDDIDENINSFVRTHEYFDVLGQLYIEFLKYANSDKGLGIVLTPPHITELFSDLAQVNSNSIVFDNCTGTGGFLISAMKKMITDAKGNQEKIKKIKSNQLIGVEYSSHIFALAVSNMYIHQDGKTNIFNGSCFEEKIIETIKKIKPTVGLLNPPYKSDKKRDRDELEFILNNLNCLASGGTCVAIVPMQSALAQRGKVQEFKKQILENHTLEAVLSMPDELFFNSNVGVVSCIMIFTAHKPHHSSKETFFGYYKNDGFIKRKTQGRFDAFNNWETIKKDWLSYFINRKTKAGFSINKVVTDKDEWSAEAYMKTDYSTLNHSNFTDTLHSYVTFLFANRLNEEVSSKSYNELFNINKELELTTSEWQEFELTSLFDITGSKTTPIAELNFYGKMDSKNGFAYVTTQATNNGVEGFYDFQTEKGNVLTVDSAVLGYCAYQATNFSASDHVEKLIPKFEMNVFNALFLVTILNLDRYRYNYGRKCSQTRMKQISISLPSKNGKIDLEKMENFIKQLPYSSSLQKY